jgi:hydrophobe/amphiphile efflux-3 (HAE3) family protein
VVGRALTALARGAARRPRATLAGVAALAVAGAVLSLGLTPTATTQTLVDRSSAAYRATDPWHRRFGDDAVIVLVREPLHNLLYTNDLVQLLGLEGCLSGNLPQGAKPPGGAHGACAQISAMHATRLVFGPATFINESAAEIDAQITALEKRMVSASTGAASRARRAALAQGQSPAAAAAIATAAERRVFSSYASGLLALAQQYGINPLAPPAIDNADYVQQVVFGTGSTPKAKFSSLFPNLQSAIVQVRLDPGIGDAQRERAIGLIRQAVAMPQWHLQSGSYLVSGVPVIVSDLTRSISRSLVVLLAVSLLVMALTLTFVFRARRRLLPLAVALAAAALTFGALAISGAPLTMASIGVLPVLIGLGVDYAIQFQARSAEEGGPERAAARGGPTIATAAAATAAGFAVLALPVIGSPVPMVRDFGLLLVAGVALAFLAAVVIGSAALSLPAEPRPAWERIAPTMRGARELITGNPLSLWLRHNAAAAGRRAFALSTAQPRGVLAVAGLLALLGWGLGTQMRVESDVQKLVPQSLSSLRDLATLQRTTHVGGEIDVMVTAPDLTTPAAVNWMVAYQRRVLQRFGYSASRGCGAATLCPAFSLPDLLGSPNTQLRQLLAVVPPYFAKAVITPDRRAATLAFGIRLMPLQQQERVVAAMRADLNPPAGVTAQLVGLPVLVADANARISSAWRRLGTLLAALLAVALVLAAALRSARRVLVVLVPVALATGWSSLILFAARLPLNPMSVTLGALVIAISTEFSVLLAERHRQEREAGHDAYEALERTYASTGAAVLASGVTATLGFAVLIASNIQMLRDFGLVTVVDLAVSLLGVMVALPAVLLIAERAPLTGAAPRLMRLRERRAGAA